MDKYSNKNSKSEKSNVGGNGNKSRDNTNSSGNSSNPNKYQEEFIFETSEDVEVYSTFDEMGLREDLIKGMNI